MAKAVRAKKSGLKGKSGKSAKPGSAARPTSHKTSKAKTPAAKKKKAPTRTAKTAPKKAAPKVRAAKVTTAKSGAKKPKSKVTAGRKSPAPQSTKPVAGAKTKTAPKRAAASRTTPRSRTARAAATPAMPAPVAAAIARPMAGQRAPDFSLPADDGRMLGLANLAGNRVVLYFYPKDDTPGCTIEAIAFSNLRAAFEAAGAVVVGVSRDSVDAHRRFKGKHNLSIPLLSDEDGDMLQRYGVWVEKNLYGRTYMGIDRTTFLIDGDGVVRRLWSKVKVEGHADEVLAAVKGL